MEIFGITIGRKKALNTIDTSRGWSNIIRESFSGAWQANETINLDTASSYFAVYSCVTLIANDIGKLKPFIRAKSDNIWQIVASPVINLLNRPNRYQNRIQFIEWWVMSKLFNGNTYVLKERNPAGKVVALYILEPSRVTPLVATDGSIYYQLTTDNLSGISQTTITVPASEIIHDRMNCLFHPLVGISPIYASGLAAGQGLRIQQDSAKFFANGAKPSGFLSAPGAISEATALRLQADWQANYSGDNAGKVAVAGDDIRYEPMRMKAVDAQLIEQLNFSAQVVCSAFHVPPFKVGVGPAESFPTNPEVLNQIYYSDCLQTLIENLELCLKDGLTLPEEQEVWMELDGLLRMDTATQYKTYGEGIKNSILSPNEARAKVNLAPVEGGNSPMAQQQNYSLEALAKRDALPDPFNPTTPTPTPAPEPEDDVAMMLRKELNLEH